MIENFLFVMVFAILSYILGWILHRKTSNNYENLYVNRLLAGALYWVLLTFATFIVYFFINLIEKINIF